jgi:hypothetical protein
MSLMGSITTPSLTAIIYLMCSEGLLTYAKPVVGASRKIVGRAPHWSEIPLD